MNLPLLRGGRVVCFAAFVCCSATVAAQSYSWTLFAGTPPPYGSVDAAGASARFYSPTGVTAGPAGNAFVTDSLNHTIRVIGPNGNVSTLAGAPRQPGSADGVGAGARFALPSGITVSGDRLYVADRMNHTIRQVTLGGVVTTFAGAPGASGSADGARDAARFNDPSDIRADAAGNLYIADRLNHVIRRIGADGLVSTIAGRAGAPGSADGPGAAARFDSPDGLALGADGSLFVADTNNHTIRRLAADGTVTTLAGAPGQAGSADGIGGAARFRLPNRIGTLSDGRLVIADTGNDCLRLVTLQGEVSVYAGAPDLPGSADGPRFAARFFGPTGVALLPDGLVVVDSLNQTIRRVGPNDQVTIFAGPGGNFGAADGPPQVARFNRPNGIARHESGDLYVADTRSSAIRRIAPDGGVTTLIARAAGGAYTDGPAGVATLNAPHGIAVAPDRTVYFCEQQRHTVRVLRPDGSMATLAGLDGNPGDDDGAGAAARFNLPSAIARDAAGSLYIADTGNHTIRKVSPGGSVTTLAGRAGSAGASDGAAENARFAAPHGVAVDASGNVYVSDTLNHTIRRIGSAGTVTTVAGFPGTRGDSDGTGSSARFWEPAGLALDRDGRLYVADTNNHTVRRIASGVVTTIGGRAGVPHYKEGAANNAFFFLPNGVAVDPSGGVYVVQHGNNLVMRGALDSSPVITAQPRPVTVEAGANATLSVNASGGGLSYQWKFNDAPIPGATTATWVVTAAQPAAAGAYSVEVTNSAGTTTSAPVTLDVVPSQRPSRIVNLSILTPLGAASDNFTMGYVVGGSGTSGAKPLVIRAAGPSLAAFGIDDRVRDPRLEFFAGRSKAGENDNWGGSPELATAMAEVGAFPYAASNSLDAAVRATVSIAAGAPSDNSVRIAGNEAGRVLAEIYDATPESTVTGTTPRLVNVSVLKEFGGGFTAGFVIRGGNAKRVLIRAVGPGLAGVGIPSGFVADPQVKLFRAQTELRSNDDWQASDAAVFAQVGAFALPAGSKDAVVVEMLPPGDYTVEVSGAGGSSGIGLVEVYEVP